ncbi:histidine--tRNA ligase [Wolbachia endosymbiont of Howardula sp.]|uniref:histidine--tRNA ligase n=1 Tax=Wolbachia endosymbiont of Howardula sp. TaxID=2916816 RepID=UPI00217E0532|nr:histidine--tRNA ligase [Wolbachia endosymbiont of Howardula sp.]UWI83024.1 histidine--tRNA ligase [Wolbachia endosymbiont of Howardula sp.]
MSDYRKVRGTKDILFDQYYQFKYIEKIASQLSQLYGFLPVQTPVFEYTEIFTKTLGKTSDIISKEMYILYDKKGKSLTLRPEFTAAVVRLLIENNLKKPIKLFSTGPIFRYERPQYGRQRQFHQINFEVFGIAEPQADVELISCAHHLLTQYGISSHVQLEINSLGDITTMINYRQALILYLTKYQHDFSEESYKRFRVNPLRILDSKHEKDQLIVSEAPKISEYYTTQSSYFFEQVLDGLHKLNIPYIINNKLVRGLDYYCHTVFEFVTQSLGAQGTVLAGGRYDDLVTTMGGKYTPALGYAGGIERIMELVKNEHLNTEQIQSIIYLVPIGLEAEKYAMILADILRRHGLYIIYEYRLSLKRRMQNAHQRHANIALIFGDEELKNKTIKIKYMNIGIEKTILQDNIIHDIELENQQNKI